MYTYLLCWLTTCSLKTKQRGRNPAGREGASCAVIKPRTGEYDTALFRRVSAGVVLIDGGPLHGSFVTYCDHPCTIFPGPRYPRRPSPPRFTVENANRLGGSPWNNATRK